VSGFRAPLFPVSACQWLRDRSICKKGAMKHISLKYLGYFLPLIVFALPACNLKDARLARNKKMKVVMEQKDDEIDGCYRIHRGTRWPIVGEETLKIKVDVTHGHMGYIYKEQGFIGDENVFQCVANKVRSWPIVNRHFSGTVWLWWTNSRIYKPKA